MSLASAQSVMNAMNKEKYDIIPIGITKGGEWLTSGQPMRLLSEAADTMPSLSPQAQSEARELIPGTGTRGIPQLDVVFPVLHGPYGEDGSMQGLLELASIPYVGCGVVGSAVGMDKGMTKALFRDAGLPTVREIIVLRSTWERDPQRVSEHIKRHLGYPCFVKPANLGSSVGISKVHDSDELPGAMDLASRHDRKLVVEEAIDAREIECSVWGNDEPIASVLGEVIPEREFYDYEAKYGEAGTKLVIPANLADDLADRIRTMAVRAFQVLDCAGLARVDFFLDKRTEVVYVNEVNTMPGFTSISMYPKLWEASGIPYSELIDRLINLALERAEDKQRGRTTQKD